MAELLIKAQEPWQITDKGSRKGDVIVVRTDGWQWGNEECLPNFIVVKVDGTEAKHKHLESPIMAEVIDAEGKKKTEVVKYRNRYIDASDVDNVEAMVKVFEKITPVQLTATIRSKDGNPA